MPAKKEYLTTPGQRALKISAGLLGGYLLSVCLHLALAVMTPFRNQILLSATFSVFFCWVGLMILAFLARNGWKIWVIYLLGCLILSLVIYLAR
jgi:hypothetical protein